MVDQLNLTEELNIVKVGHIKKTFQNVKGNSGNETKKLTNMNFTIH